MVCFKIFTTTYFWRVQGKKLKLYFVLLQLWLFCHLVQMPSAPDLVPGLLCSLFWVLCSCPCFQNIAQHHLTRTLFSFSPVVISLLLFFSAFPFILFPFLSSCMYVKLGAHLLKQQVIWFPWKYILSETMNVGLFFGFFFRMSPYVLLCLNPNLP